MGKLERYDSAEKVPYFSLSRREVDYYKAKTNRKRMTEVTASLIDTWEEVPQAESVKKGDLILYRYKNEVPNIHMSMFGDLTAYPDKIDSIQKENNQIVSVTVTEVHFTAFDNPFKRAKSLNDDLEKAIKLMKKNGLLKSEKKTIPVADFRLFNDVNKMLAEKFNFTLPKIPQDFEPFLG